MLIFKQKADFDHNLRNHPSDGTTRDRAWDAYLHNCSEAYMAKVLYANRPPSCDVKICQNSTFVVLARFALPLWRRFAAVTTFKEPFSPLDD